MAGDTNSNIFINIDTSQAMAQLRALEKELTALNRALVVGTKTAAAAQASYAQSLLHNVNATGQWTAATTKMSTASEQFAQRLDKSKLSLKEYYRYGMASTKAFGKFFASEFDTVSKLAERRVKTLQTQYVQLGRDASGAMNALKFVPKNLNYKDLTTQLMMATQRQQILNKLLDDGATKLLNFGKNTQWAGRQLMVGFTIPLMLFGTQAIRSFKEIETATIKFKKVYGSIYTTTEDTNKALKNIRAIADEYTKFGVKIADTIDMAAQAAAAGFQGEALQAQVKQASKLAVLGQIEQQQALETTISLQNAFGVSTKDLASNIDFLNAVENQTVLSLDDVTTAIPKVAPVVKQLGGDVKDLAFFMTAMKEGGISASQGANALKSGLASLINPTKKAQADLAKLGINLKGIIEANAGNLRGTVVAFANALAPLSDLQRARSIEEIFGKYQFARISTLLQNVTKEGSQAQKVLQLTNASVEELAILSEREMKIQSESPMYKMQQAIEQLKKSIAPIGEVFAKTITPAIQLIGKLFEKFDKLPDGVKKAIATVVAVIGGLGPVVLMTVGLVANGIANMMKMFNLLRKGYQQLAYGSKDTALKTQYLSEEELKNISVSNALYTKHEALASAYRLETEALVSLVGVYKQATTAMGGFAVQNPGMFKPGTVPVIRRADGGSVNGPGGPTSDLIPAYLSNGEYVVSAKAVDHYGVDTFDAMNARRFGTGGYVQQYKNNLPAYPFGNPVSYELLNFGARAEIKALETARFPAGLRQGVKPISKARLDWPTIPWTENPSKPGMLIIRDPKTGQEFAVKKSAKEEYDKLYADLVKTGKVRKRGDRPEMSPAEYLLYRLDRYENVKGKPLTSSNIFGQVGIKGKSRVRSADQGARSRWQEALMKNAKAQDLVRYYDNEYAYVASKLAERGVVAPPKLIDASHIEGVGKERAGSWTADKIIRDTNIVNRGLNYATRSSEVAIPNGTRHPTSQAELDKIAGAIQEAIAKGKVATPYDLALIETANYRRQNGFYNKYKIFDKDLGVESLAFGTPGIGIGMPLSFAKVKEGRLALSQLEQNIAQSKMLKVPATDFGHLIKPFTGRSFPVRGVGGIYRKPDGSIVVVKPFPDLKTAEAEVRASIIAKNAHKLNASDPVIKTMIDPTDVEGKRKFIVVESPYIKEFANPTGKFTNKEYVKQLLAASLRGDKDTALANISGSNVVDPGTAYVMNRASGFRQYGKIASVGEMASAIVLAFKGGAKRAFAEATLENAQSMTSKEFKRQMLAEINSTLPELKRTIKGFNLTGEDKIAYDNVISRLEAAKKVDWEAIHAAHLKVKPLKLADGIFEVPGPKGAGDVVPAMLTPGEAVIPARQSAKYAPLVSAIIKDNVPGHEDGVDPGKGYTVTDKRSSARIQSENARIMQEETKKTTASFKDLSKAIGKSTTETLKSSKAFSTINNAAANISARVPRDRTTGFSGYMLGYGRVPTVDENGIPLTREQRINARQGLRMQNANRMMGIQMAAMALPMAAGAYAAKNPESGIAQNMGLITGISTLAMFLPMLNSPLKMLIASAIGLGVAFKMQSAAIKQALVDGKKNAEALTMTTSKLEQFGQITGRVSAAQIAQRQRQGRTTEITPVSTEFGYSFMGGDAGKKFMDDFNKSVEQFGTKVAGTNLANQLSTAVLQGVLTANEAESIAAAIARSLKDTTLEASVRGRIVELVGPNGQNLQTDPLSIQIKLNADQRDLQKILFNNLQTAVSNVNKGPLGISLNRANTQPGGPIMGNPINWGEGQQLAGTVATGVAVTRALQAIKAIKAASVAAAVATGPETAGLGTGISLGVGYLLTAAATLAVRQWQRGEEKKFVAKNAGMLSGLVTETLKSSQEGLDAVRQQYDIGLQNLELQKKVAKTEQEKADIQQRIFDLQTKRGIAEQTIRDQQAKQIADAANYVDQLSSKEGKTKYAEAYKTQLQDKFKDNPYQKAQAQALINQMEQQKVDIKGQIELSTLITSDQLTVGQATQLLTTVTSQGKDLTKEINTIVKAQGTEGLSRITEVLQYVNNDKNKNTVYMNVAYKDKTQADEVLTGLEELIKMPSSIGIDMNLETNPDDIKKVQRVGKEITALKKQFPKGQVDLKALLKMQQDLGGAGKNLTLDAAIKQWSTISQLPKDLRFNAIFTLGAINISDSFGQKVSNELDAAFKKSTEYASSRQLPAAAQESIYNAWKAKNSTLIDKIKSNALKDIYGIDVTTPTKTPGPADTTGGNKPDLSFVTGILQKLKMYNEAAVRSIKDPKDKVPFDPFAELMKWFPFSQGGADVKTINKKPGTINDWLNNRKGALEEIDALAKKAGLTFSTNFRDAIEGLDPQGFQDLATTLFKMDKDNRITDITEKFKALNEAVSKATIGEFIDKQNQSNKATDQQIEAYRRLIDINGQFKVTGPQAMEALKDSALTAEIAMGKVFSTEEIKAFTASLKKTTDQLVELSRIKLDQQNKDLVKQLEAYDKLKAAGVDYATILEIIKDKGTAWAVASAAEGTDIAKTFAGLIGDIQAFKKLQDQLAYAMKTPAEKLTDAFTAAEAKITLNAMANFRKVNKMSVDEYQAVTDSIQRQLDKQNEIVKQYQDGLDLIAKKEQDINDIYAAKQTALDDQVKALDQIASLNNEISQAQRSQLSVASALSQGDIAAAAQAAEQARAEYASNRLQQSQNAIAAEKNRLEKQQKLEIDALTASINGKEMTRIELNKAIQALQDGEIKKLQDIIDARNKIIETYNYELDQQLKNLEIQGMTKNEWDSIKSAVDAINAVYGEQVINLDDIATGVGGIESAWIKVLNAINAANKAISENKLRTTNYTLDSTDTFTKTSTSQEQTAATNDAAKQATEASTAALDASNTADAAQSAADAAAAAADATAAEIAGISADLDTLTKGANDLLANLAKQNASTAAAIAAKIAKKKTTTTPPKKSGTSSGGSSTTAASSPDAARAGQNAGNTSTKLFFPSAGKGSPKTNPTMTLPNPAPRKPGTGFAMGGLVPPTYLAAGGYGPRGTDTVPAWLTPGEYVVNRNSTQKFLPILKTINAGTYSVPSGASYGINKSNITNSVNNNSHTVYNYDIGITVGGSNSNPDDIARTVIDQIKYIDSQRIRKQKAI